MTALHVVSFVSDISQLFSTKDGPEKAYLQPIISTPEWNQALSKLSTLESQKGYAVIICGPKGSGKSTFAKLLTNRLLSSATPTTAARRPIGVAILDLDPGQPEYSPQGQLSLIHVQEPNFGTPFTHPVPSIPNRLVRAHTIGAITPSLDPDLYISCALDLFKHYRNLLTDVPGCPLIINTPGWILGTGLEILVELISKMQPTEVMYMSQEGPSEVVGSLKEASKKTPVFTLPSQVSEYTTRTAAHLRTMQAMSYFHLNSQPTKELVWDGRPLTCVPPWEIKYSGEGAGILGILCYGEQPPPDLLLEAINGTLVAVVVIEDMAAIPGWDSESEDSMGGDLVLQTNNVEALSRLVHKPLIVRTAEEKLPYFNNLNTILLSPSHSYCLGLALIRGIDVKRQRLQVLTPILPSKIFAISNEGKKIVLVSGKFDTPGWAYIEELNRKGEKKKAAKKAAISESEEVGEADGSDEEMEDPQKGGGMERFAASGTEEVPWVEKLKGSQGRGVGARVWRVRRDLGRSGDGD
jgi:polynucleotide 5'-hydroxyl-kinase GRC3/NOL9